MIGEVRVLIGARMITGSITVNRRRVGELNLSHKEYEEIAMLLYRLYTTMMWIHTRQPWMHHED